MEEVIKKKGSRRQTLKRMIKDFKKEYTLLIIIIILNIGAAVLSIVAPIFLGEFLNKCLPNPGLDFVGGLADNPLFGLDAAGEIIQINWPYFTYIFGTLLGMYAGGALLSWLAEFLSVSVSTRYAFDFRNKIKAKLDRLPLNYYDLVPYGDTLSIGTNDIDYISRNLQSIIVQLVNGVAMFIGTLIAMLIYQWELALIALVSLPITLTIVVLIAKTSQKQFKTYRKELGVLNGKIEENYAGYTIIKLFNKEEDVENEFNEINSVMSKADGLSQFLSGFIFPTTIFINNLAYVGIAVVGGIIGEVGTMITFFTLLSLFSRPFQQIGQISNVIQQVLASGERIYSLLDEPEEIPDKEDAIRDESVIQGDFDFDKVFFQYVKNKPLIENFTLHVNKGDTVAIVGPTGAGKTTMVNLIMRFYELTNIKSYEDLKMKSLYVVNEINKAVNLPIKKSLEFKEDLPLTEATILVKNKFKEYIKEIRDEELIKWNSEDDIRLKYLEDHLDNLFNNGCIYLDGKPTTAYSRETLRGAVGMVLQETWLFKGTIKENLLFGDPNATDEEIALACKEAHIDHFIHTLPGGYDFMLTEDGENVSQGQRQLLTIARAIISKPKILILDEATSSVDTRTEQQIQDALDNIMVGRTSFVIAHRLSTIKNAKLIIVMKKGNIVEIGNHKELLKKNGFYAELYNSQFSGSNPMSKEQEDS